MRLEALWRVVEHAQPRFRFLKSGKDCIDIVNRDFSIEIDVGKGIVFETRAAIQYVDDLQRINR